MPKLVVIRKKKVSSVKQFFTHIFIEDLEQVICGNITLTQNN